MRKESGESLLLFPVLFAGDWIVTAW